MQRSQRIPDDPAFWTGQERRDPTRSGAPLVRWPRWVQILLFEITIVIAAGALVRLPYHSLGAGPTYDMFEYIDVEGAATHASEGELRLTTASVSTSTLSIWEVLYTWMRPDLKAIHRFDLVPPWSTGEEQRARNKQDIEESKVAALVGAFGALGEPTVPGSIIVGVEPHSPADGVARAGDHIVAVDGRAVRTPGAVFAAIRRRTPGDPITLNVIRNGRARDLEVQTICVEDVRKGDLVATHPCAETIDGEERAFVGILPRPAYDFPDDLRIDTGDVVGPSGGLVFALTIVDLFTRSDLTKGHVIAVTGTIEIAPDGRAFVGPIGGATEKVRGAQDAGATVFLVPVGEAEEARAVAPPGMRVIAVRTLGQAVKALRSLEPHGRP
jgi:PDZ domain-containing protein